MKFLKRKSEECNGRQNNALLSERQSEPYGKIVPLLEQPIREGSTTALLKRLRILLQAAR